MKHLHALLYGLNVTPILEQLEAHPELWNQHTLRTAGYAPAHNDVSDIWVRYNPFERFTNMLPHVSRELAVQQFVAEEHDSAWYPAIDSLPSLRALIFDLMHGYEVERLGGVLITSIRPGGEVRPHVDRGWHAGYYEKIAVQLKSAPGQRFCFADGGFECPAGTAYAFDNSFEHWVENPTEYERMTCIICVRRDARKPPLYSGTGE